MNDRISKLILVVLTIAATACGIALAPTLASIATPSALTAAPQEARVLDVKVNASSPIVTSSRVWHHRSPGVVGEEVLALYGEPGFGGWMTFLHSVHVAKRNDEGEWELQLDNMAARIHELAPLIRQSGFLMLDSEGPLYDHENLALYMEAVRNARTLLRNEGLYDIRMGGFRIPDHAKSNTINRLAFVPVLPHTDAVFIMVKNTGERFREYVDDVAQVAPDHSVVVYMDAYSRINGQPFTRERVLDTVRLACLKFDNPQIVFRQEGPHVVQAIRWALDWLGYEEQTP